MTDSPLHLKFFLCDDPAKPVAPQVDLAQATRALESACANVPAAAVPGMAEAFRSALDDVLAVDLAGVLSSSWGRVAAVSDALQATRASPDAIVLVPLLDHKIVSTHKPAIELFLGPKRLAEILLELVLTLELRGVTLGVKGGRIDSIRAGACLGRGVLSCAGKPMANRVTPEFTLPGRISFGA